MIIPAIVFIAWDAWFTTAGVWSFSKEHTIGIGLFGLPIEEILFFITVPYCCLFIYECVRTYFPRVYKIKAADVLFYFLPVVFMFIAVFHIRQAYTAVTLFGLFAFSRLLYYGRKYFASFDAASFLLSYLIILVPFLVVNGFLTSIPVVMYNDLHNLGIRIFSFLPSPMNNIPVEDIFYGMLLILMNVAFYERFLKRNSS